MFKLISWKYSDPWICVRLSTQSGPWICSCHCILIFVHCQVQSLCWPLCAQVICVSNLRTTCLQCILSPTSFQFFENFQKQWWQKANEGEGWCGRWGGGGGGWEEVGDQWCCGIKIKCFCFTLTVIFHVQVEVHVEFTYLSVDGTK